ncbi:Adhesion G-protein coupled receptor G4 [Dissostichus eleginoides]|uniref:Adhesion G-protein coupled receptor G4 n=1 Tax=Dissostichus eleginoides TaxID=100907 RepID=A0AAD9CKR4_DISEL|nr:Adhesion G-protein coupled receptor G4 [Dissostichus eleginoides]
MNSFRSVSSITLICLCWQILGSTASASTSLWGKKLVFMHPRCTWQLQPDVVLPAFKELTVCTLLRRTIDSEWTGFDYRAPGGGRMRLGGTSTKLSVWLFEEEHSLKWGLKLNEWYSVCVTWSGHARRLQIYINGSSEYEVSLNPLQYQLAPNGTLTLGMSHIIMSGEVKRETGKDLLGEIGRFRMWAREWSAEELGGRSCADGDLVRWDLTQWKSDCFPELDNNLKCAWSHYKIKMWTSMVPSTEPGNCSKSLEEVTQNWLQSIFPDNISVQHIRVSSPSRACRVVNNSAALSAQQPQESRALSNSTCDKCFRCEVNANVDPTAEVEVVQARILSLLNSTFSYDFLNLTAYPNSISILPVELPEVLKPLPTASTETPTSAFAPDTFFRVNLTLSMTGSPTKPEEVIEKWLKEQLEVNATMEVLNVIIKENVGRYDCTFNVQEYNINSVAEIIAFIHVALTAKYLNNSIIIQTTEVAVKHIVLANCLEENTSTIYGEYIWPETFPQENQKMGCNKPTLKRAYRLCKLDIETDTTSWADPDMKNCKQLVTISDLDNITVTTGNAAGVVDMIQDLIDVQLDHSESELSSSELDTVVDKLREVVHISGTTPAVGANIVNIVANILLSKTDLTPVAGIVLNLTDKMANNMDFPDESVSITAPLLALALINVNRNKFSGLTFGVSSVSPTLNPEIFVNQNFESGPLPDTNATISLPSELYNYFPPGERNTTRIQFQFYASNELFQDPYTNNATQTAGN